MAYFEMLKETLKDLTILMRGQIYFLGSGALAATTYPLDRYAVARIIMFPI